ncbi:hypothetical protein TNCV_3057811 [Trichonephila clavipes]|nr:hypothetical protein TNCV_3057811 [Trichonephila clavipes]
MVSICFGNIQENLEMSKRSYLPDSLSWWSIGWTEMLLSPANAAGCLNVSHTVIRQVWDQFKSEDSVPRRYGRL